MDILKSVIIDIALVAIFAAFIDLFLPKSSGKIGVKLVFGLYFLAILLNPVVNLLTNTDFASLDFTDLAVTEKIEIETHTPSVLEAAAASLNQELATKLTALFETGDFTAEVTMEETGIVGVKVLVKGISDGKSRVVEAEIKEFLAKDYGVKKRKTEVIFV